MADRRRLRRYAALRWALAPIVAALVAAAACSSPGPALSPTAPPTTSATVAPMAHPASAAPVVTAEPSPSAVFHLKSADELEQLRGGGQPLLLAVLDRSHGNSVGDNG